MDCKGDYTRERLFRGKSFDDGAWFVSCYIWEVWRHIGERKVRLISLSDGTRVVHVYPQTIGEFTGACTDNGTKIFEGDIIGFPRWIVTYSTGMKCCSGMQAGWYIQRDNWESWTELKDTNNIIILGNIHDNPELLEVR